MSLSKSLKHHVGYFLIDHRSSPGNDKVPEGAVYEGDIAVCCHCSAVVFINSARTRPRNICHKCSRYTCDSPSCVTNCTNFEKMLDELQERNFKLVDKYGEEVTCNILASGQADLFL